MGSGEWHSDASPHVDARRPNQLAIASARENRTRRIKLHRATLYTDRFCRAEFIAQRPCLKLTDVALRDAETSVKNHHSVTIYIQLLPVQRKIQHTSPSILAVTKNRVQFPLPSSIVPKLLDTRPRMQLFSQTNSLAGSKTAPVSRMSILCTEHHALASVIPHCEPDATVRNTTFACATACVR